MYPLSAKIISRSKCRSVVAAAAERAGLLLRANLLGVDVDFQRTTNIAHSELVAPAGSPAWAQRRETLWNEVDASETRRDSQLAREIVLRLPHDLTLAKQLRLARAFVREQFVARGMVADFAIHQAEEPHVHVLLTTRHLSLKGFGNKNTDWNDRTLLLLWRDAWAEQSVRALWKTSARRSRKH